ncbi:hypothetical protein [Pseudomonas sp. FYR_7]|uniref:hypothetical protein n=1 Tax=Pseudomonas sp. FYR_7 TaxID=3367174 RepID=UPI00370A567F
MTNIAEKVDSPSCLAVFTCRGLQRILREGGSQAWRLSTSNASKIRYIVCVQNRNLEWGNASHPHGTAFLVGKISGVESLKEDSKGDVRKIVKISEYAEIDVPDCWDGGRNPIAYMKLSDFGLKLDELDFKPVPVLTEAHRIGDNAPIAEDELPEDQVGLTIEQAKRGLAISLGIRAEQIEILIRA